MPTRTIELELGQRKAGSKTFPAVISTETPVKRSSWEHGEFFEVLSHKKSAVDLSRAPLPLLESHNARSLPVGVVDSLRIVGGKLRGEVRFGASARASEIAADVEAGVIRNLSVGYSIDKAVEERDGDTTTITATRWTPHEASAVAIGADAGAGFGRSAAQGESPMPKSKSPSTEPTHTREANLADMIPEQRIEHYRSIGDEVRAERERVTEIHRVARELGEIAPDGSGVLANLASDLVERGASLAEARSSITDAYCRAAQNSPGNRIDPSFGERELMGGSSRQRASWLGPRVSAPGGRDDFHAAARDAILMRAGVQVSEPHAAARDVDASVLGLARVCLSRSGKTASGGDDRLIRGAMTTSDFPLILADSIGKAVRLGYEDEPASNRDWVRPVPVRDFKEQTRVILGSAPDLEKVLEGGEYNQGAMDEDAAKYMVAKFGRIVTLSWELLVNDDLSAFMRVQPAMGQAARRKEADTVYALFAENAGAGPAMQDGNNLFDDTEHGNLVPAAVFDAAQLGLGRQRLRKQTAVGGGFLSLVPRFMIAPAERETEAEILLAQATKHINVVGTEEADTPRWLRNLELVVEPRLADGAVYLAADSSQIDTVELGLLSENMGGPVIETKEGFEVDDFEWKVRHVFGAKFLDWRGIVKVELN